MPTGYINLSLDNLEHEHLCCAIADKKHQGGVDAKKSWLRDRLAEGHVFRKLDAKGKVFIEYAPLEKAWVPVEGENYLYVYCLWVSGSFKDFLQPSMPIYPELHRAGRKLLLGQRDSAAFDGGGYVGKG